MAWFTHPIKCTRQRIKNIKKLQDEDDQEQDGGGQENTEMKDFILGRKRQPSTWNGQKLTPARDVNNIRDYDDLKLVVVGVDIEAL